MRIGVVSDTHDNLTNAAKIVEIFNAASVARVVHTGDITRARTLEIFARLDAPLYGVYGNNDHERGLLHAAAVALGFHLDEPPLRVRWAEREITIVHDPEQVAFAAAGVLLHGHDHRRRIERAADSLIFNPGECAGFIPGHNAVGVLDLADLDVRIHEF